MGVSRYEEILFADMGDSLRQFKYFSLNGKLELRRQQHIWLWVPMPKASWHTLLLCILIPLLIPLLPFQSEGCF